MKYLIALLLFLVIASDPNDSFGINEQNPSSSEKSLKLLSSPHIYPLTQEWITKYEGLKPGTQIAAGMLNTDESIKPNYLYFLSESDPILQRDSLWKMVVGREAIVPVVNLKNPLLDKMLHYGINSKKFHQLLTEGKQTWGTLLEEGITIPVRIFISGDSLILSKLAEFAQVPHSFIKNKVTFVNGQDLSSILENVDAIEFCRLSDIINPTNNQFIEGITILPIDKNQNNRIDSFEKIYTTPQSFTRGVWIGKYPHSLCGNIYAVAASRPADKNILELLTWIQKGGQDFLGSGGFSTLASTERNSNIEELNNSFQLVAGKRENIHIIRIFLSILLIAFIVTGYYLIISRKKKIHFIRGNKPLNAVMSEDSLIAPKGLFFDKTHTWAFMEREGMVKIGIDDFLQHITGELTHVILKEPGTMVRKGDKIITISHKGKKLDIHAPISGIIRERNKSLMFDPTLINSSPYQDGWLYVIEPKNWLKENHFLFMWEKYLEWLSDEINRLKDFFGSRVSALHVSTEVILQDGGEISDHPLSDLDPEIWEEFQQKFIDRSR